MKARPLYHFPQVAEINTPRPKDATENLPVPVSPTVEDTLKDKD
ncbi:MAG TPA: hypothetical protein VF359_12050 [Anaerolineales bacterium]|jgi:hypothetical protein